jgi:SAM-dependent methyltransferase
VRFIRSGSAISTDRSGARRGAFATEVDRVHGPWIGYSFGVASTAIEPSTQYNAELYEELYRRFPFRGPERLPWYPAIRQLCDRAPDRLEIGPGVMPRMPLRGTHVIDLSAGALDVLARHGGIVHHGLLDDQRFADASFDVVGMFEVLEHVAEDERLLREIARITRPGGHLILTVPLGMKHYNAFDRYMGHVRRFEPDELCSKVERAGYVLERFEVHEQSVFGPAASLYVAVMRHFPLLTASGRSRNDAVVETDADTTREAYLARMQALTDGWREEVVRRGGRFLRATTDDDPVRTVANIVEAAR